MSLILFTTSGTATCDEDDEGDTAYGSFPDLLSHSMSQTMMSCRDAKDVFITYENRKAPNTHILTGRETFQHQLYLFFVERPF